MVYKIDLRDKIDDKEITDGAQTQNTRQQQTGNDVIIFILMYYLNYDHTGL